MQTQKTILVVEDNEINRMMIREILSCEYRVLEAENGQAALQVLKNHAGELALILLDIVMPVMDGYTFLSHIRGDPALASIPVIVTTQSENESDEVTALSKGATDFVTKPYKPQVILHRVANIIKLRETAAMVNQFQHDRLTGLYSKEFFYQRVKTFLQQYPEKKYDIVYSNIENFKLINDVFGVPAGDRLLRGVARLIERRVDGWGICARMNADQFACLLEHQVEYTDEIFLQLGKQVNALANAKSVVMKWGVYTVEDRAIPAEQMCDRALLAARSIKGQYGKYFALYDDELRSRLLREQAITDGMESALAEGQFQIYLQPKYRIRDDTLAGAEALVRWNHPQLGFQSPAEFIPLFEKNGFITKLDQFVWDRACRVLKEWEDKKYPPLSISINVSRADIYNADIADILLRTVRSYGISPSRLHLEITESAYTENPDQIIDTVSHLRDLGFVIEMDDFGSGYSSLNMLNQMPIDILKLDMHFIQSETAKPAERGILRFIMELARHMDLSVVAEGVETREQLDRLIDTGCDYVQGYFFARPMPCEEFEALIRQQRAALEQGAQAGRPGQDRHKQVLLVADEDADYRSQVESAFRSRFQVVQAGDVQEALDYLNQEVTALAAVLLSLTLPGPDGFAVLKALQQKKEAWRIPVIATGRPDARLEEQALERGADDFAVKPHTQNSLRRRVARALNVFSLQDRERGLQDDALRDYLTGLLNRRGFYTAVEPLRGANTPFALFLFDLEDLKRINDALGHPRGDLLLKKFGAILASHTRESDILARFGGDEFIVITKHLASEEHAMKKGEEICRALGESGLAGDIPTRCSGGIAICGAHQPMAELIEQADQALYQAKMSNKGGCCLWRG